MCQILSVRGCRCHGGTRRVRMRPVAPTRFSRVATFPMYKTPELRYNVSSMAAIRAGTLTPLPDARKGGRSRRTLLFVLGFILVFMVFDALVGERGLVALLRAREEYQQRAAEVGRARARNAELRATALRLRDDPAAIEEIARRELGLIKPGEKLFIIHDVAPPPRAADVSR
jgi:cell division protein FtsB